MSPLKRIEIRSQSRKISQNHLSRIKFFKRKKTKHTKSRLVKLQTEEVNQNTKSDYNVKKKTFKKTNLENGN